MKKKAVETINLVIAMAILLVFLAVAIQFYFGGFRKIFSNVGSQIDSQQDYDNDGVPDFSDKCPCPPNSGSIENDGCPAGSITKEKEDRSCLVKK